MSTNVRKNLNRDGVKGKYFLISTRNSCEHGPSYRFKGRVYVRTDATGNDPQLQDIAAFEKILEHDNPSYYAQLEAFRLAAKLGVLDKYYRIAERRKYSHEIFSLAKLESAPS